MLNYLAISSVVIGLLAGTPDVATSARPACDQYQLLQGLCPDIENKEDHLELDGYRYDNQQAPDDHGGNQGESSPDGPETSEPDGSLPFRYQRCYGEDEPDFDLDSPCLLPQEDSEPEPPEIPPLTQHDVARFAPVPPAVSAEPLGIAVVGAPMNAVAPASPHAVAGELFDLPVVVSFTPSAYLFNYGDGTTRSTTTGGATWADLNLPEFTATETSHSYRERGQRVVTVSVEYTAMVDFGPWGVHSVDGVVTTTSPGTSVRVVESRSALTDDD